MAKNTVNIKFQTDVTALEEAKKKLEELLSSKKKIELDPYKLGLTDSDTALLKEMSKEIKATEKTIESLGAAVEKYQGKAASDVEKSQAKIAAAAEKAQARVAAAAKKTAVAADGKEATQVLKGQEKAVDLLSKSEDRRLSVLNRTRRALGQSFLEAPLYTASFAMMKLMSESIRYYIEFDKVLTRIAIVGERSTESMQTFADYANAAGLALGVTGKAFAEATSIFVQQGGLAADNAASLADATIKLANITGESASNISEYITGIMNSFKLLETDGVAAGNRIADVLARLDAISGSSANEIAEAFQRSASSFAAAGFEMEDAAAILSVVSETTRQTARMVGTGFKTLIGNINEVRTGTEQYTQITNKLDQVTRRFGVSFSLLDEFTGDMKATPVLLQEIADIYGNLTSRAAKNALIEAVAGKEQRDRFIALMENQERYKELLDEARTSANAADQAQSLYMESIAGKIEQVSNRWEEFTQGLINQNLFKSILDQLSAVMGLVNDLIKSGPGLTSIFARVGATFLPLIAGGAMGHGRLRETGQQMPAFMSHLGGRIESNVGPRVVDRYRQLIDQRGRKGGLNPKELAELGEYEGEAREAKAGRAAIGAANVILTGTMTAVSLAMNDQLTTSEKVTQGFANMAPAIGSLFGPFGTLAGSLIGMGISFLGANKEVQAFRDELRKISETAKESLVNTQARLRAEELLSTVETTDPGSEEYVLAANQLAELFPGMVMGTDPFGDAILASTEAMREYIKVIGESVQLQEYKNVLEQIELLEQSRRLFPTQEKTIEENKAAIVAGRPSMIPFLTTLLTTTETYENLGKQIIQTIFPLIDLGEQVDTLTAASERQIDTIAENNEMLKQNLHIGKMLANATAKSNLFKMAELENQSQILSKDPTAPGPSVSSEQLKNIQRFGSQVMSGVGEDFFVKKNVAKQLEFLINETKKYADIQQQVDMRTKHRIEMLVKEGKSFTEVAAAIKEISTDYTDLNGKTIKVVSSTSLLGDTFEEEMRKKEKYFSGLPDDTAKLAKVNEEFESLQALVLKIGFPDDFLNIDTNEMFKNMGNLNLVYGRLVKIREEFAKFQSWVDVHALGGFIGEASISALKNINFEFLDVDINGIENALRQASQAAYNPDLDTTEMYQVNAIDVFSKLTVGDEALKLRPDQTLSSVQEKLQEAREKHELAMTGLLSQRINLERQLGETLSSAVVGGSAWNKLSEQNINLKKQELGITSQLIASTEYQISRLGSSKEHLKARNDAQKNITNLMSQQVAIERELKILEFDRASSGYVKFINDSEQSLKRLSEQLDSVEKHTEDYLKIITKTLEIEKERSKQQKEYVAALAKAVRDNPNNLEFLNRYNAALAQQATTLKEIRRLTTEQALQEVQKNHVPLMDENEQKIKRINEEMSKYLNTSDQYIKGLDETLAIQGTNLESLKEYVKSLEEILKSTDPNIVKSEIQNTLNATLDQLGALQKTIRDINLELITLTARKDFTLGIEKIENDLRKFNEQLNYSVEYSDAYFHNLNKIFELEGNRLNLILQQIDLEKNILEINKDLTPVQRQSILNNIKALEISAAQYRQSQLNLQTEILLANIQKDYLPFIDQNATRIRRLNEQIGQSILLSRNYMNLTKESLDLEKENYRLTLNYIKALDEKIKIQPDNIKLVNEYNQALDSQGQLVERINAGFKELARMEYDEAIFGTADVEGLVDKYQIITDLTDKILDNHEQIVERSALELNIKKELEETTNNSYKIQLKYLQNQIKDNRLTEQSVRMTRARFNLIKNIENITKGGESSGFKLNRTAQGSFRYSGMGTSEEQRLAVIGAINDEQKESRARMQEYNDQVFALKRQLPDLTGEARTGAISLIGQLEADILTESKFYRDLTGAITLADKNQLASAQNLALGKITLDQLKSSFTAQELEDIEAHAAAISSTLISQEGLLIKSQEDLIESNNRLIRALEIYANTIAQGVKLEPSTPRTVMPTTPATIQPAKKEADFYKGIPYTTIGGFKTYGTGTAGDSAIVARGGLQAHYKTLHEELETNPAFALSELQRAEGVRDELLKLGEQQGRTIDTTIQDNYIIGLKNVLAKKTFHGSEIEKMETGGYTGDFDGGKLAILHEKELVLNKMDTENILNAVEMLRPNSNIMEFNRQITPLSRTGTDGGQNMVINASFPGVSSSEEIQRAFKSMSTKALQYAYRTKSY